MRARLARPDADADRRPHGQSAPGMAVTVEIKTGSRRIIGICCRRCCGIGRRHAGTVREVISTYRARMLQQELMVKVARKVDPTPGMAIIVVNQSRLAIS